jgi:hypothetical protein
MIVFQVESINDDKDRRIKMIGDLTALNFVYVMYSPRTRETMDMNYTGLTFTCSAKRCKKVLQNIRSIVRRHNWGEKFETVEVGNNK